MLGRAALVRMLLVVTVLGGGRPAAADQHGDRASPDVFAAALSEVGVTESDLGARPLRHWNRYPHPATVPHVLPFFADLHAHPLDTYEFARSLGNAVEKLLASASLHDDEDALFHLGVVLATERRIGGFRSYSANLAPVPEGPEPLLAALLALLERAGQPLEQGRSFGKDGERKEDPVARLDAELARIPKALHPALARLVRSLTDARGWVERGFRNVPQELRDAVFDAAPRLVDVTPGGREYFPAIDDAVRLVDEHSLWYGCLKALQAVQDARRDIEGLRAPSAGWDDFDVALDSPWGEVRFSSGGTDMRAGSAPFAYVGLGGTGVVGGPLGATDRRHPLSVALLIDPPPTIGCTPETGLDACRAAAIASGIVGCGVVYVAGTTDNRYRASDFGLGAGLFGLGALIDEGGADHYSLRSAGMGTGFFGAGLLLDAEGDDRYVLEGGDGQGYGGPGGIGILADRSGADSYYAEPDPAKAGRADYHSDYKVAVSFAQGAGVGRRGDGSDGQVWAGGLGALIDVDGDDHYRAGNFSQGVGYWLGTGLLWDGGGDDEYQSVFYTQGSGAHFSIGALVDEGGDDTHAVAENAALGFGWDVVNGFLIDRGAGSDRYRLRTDGLGAAMLRSHAFFVDEGGDDTYEIEARGHGLGYADDQDNYVEPGPTTVFPYHLSQVGLFLDLGGSDTYLRRAGGATTPDRRAGDDRAWHVQKRETDTRSGPNVSIGKDVEEGRAGFLEDWPARVGDAEPE